MRTTIPFDADVWSTAAYTALVLGGTAWLMAALGWLFAPVPMFLASWVAGVRLHGRPQSAMSAGILAGCLGGIASEAAFYLLRYRGAEGWLLLSTFERLGISAAEGLMYAAFLGFFSAFFSWGVSRERSRTIPREIDDDDFPDHPSHPGVELPLFRPADEPRHPDHLS